MAGQFLLCRPRRPARVDRALTIDLELTCWEGEAPSGEQPEIIEVGVVEIDIPALSIIREDRYLVRPSRSSVSTFCTSLTGLDASDLRKHGRPFGEVCRTLRKSYGSAGKPWFAWGRDDEAIACQLDESVPAPFAGPFMDLSLLYGLTFPSHHREGLARACADLGLTWRGAKHRALNDARMTALVLIELLRRSRVA